MTKHINQSFRAIPPAIGDISAASLPGLTTATTDAGLRIHSLCKPDIPVVGITALARGGCAEAGTPAAAWFKCMMQSKATRSFDEKKLADIIDFNGANLKSTAEGHYTRQTLLTLQGNTDVLLPVMAEISGTPTFPDHELKVLAEAMAANIEVCFENVSYLAEIEADRQIMGNDHPLAAIDDPQQIRRFTPADLASLHRRDSTLDGLDIFLCGNITPDIIYRLQDAYTAVVPAGEGLPLRFVPFTPAPAGDRRLIVKPDASQSAVSLSIPVIGRSHPDYLPLHMAVYALGGYFGSRLMLNIREDKGLTYGISAALVGHPEGSYIRITAETDNRYVDRLIEEVNNELNRLATDPPAADELIRMRRSAMSEQISITDNPLSILNFHISARTCRLPDGYFNRKLATIASITTDQIADVAARYLRPELLRTVIAGNPSNS